jgi:hypothetical protein
MDITVATDSGCVDTSDITILKVRMFYLVSKDLFNSHVLDSVPRKDMISDDKLVIPQI